MTAYEACFNSHMALPMCIIYQDRLPTTLITMIIHFFHLNCFIRMEKHRK